MRNFSQKTIEFSFYILFFLVPLFFNAASHELFEYNKMMLTYGITIIIAAAWIIKGLKNFKRTALDIPIALYLVSHLLSTIFSLDPHTSFWGYYSRFHEGLLATISYIILYYAAVSNLNRFHVLNILKVSLISALIVSIYGAFEHFGHSPSCLFITGNFDVSCWVQDVQGRVFATLGQPNWMAAYLDVVILIMIGIIFQKNQKTQQTRDSDKSDVQKLRLSDFLSRPNFLKTGLLIIYFLALLFTKSRSGFLGLGAGLFIFTVFILKIEFRFKLLICVLAFIATSLYGWHRYQNLPPPAPGITDSEAIRKPVWDGAIKVWKRYPVFGSGVETFAYSYYLDRPAEHNLLSEWDFLYNKAHNEFLNILATTGTVGMMAYLALIGVSLWVLKKNPSLLAAYVSILVTNFFGFSVVIIGLYFFLIPAFYEILKD